MLRSAEGFQASNRNLSDLNNFWLELSFKLASWHFRSYLREPLRTIDFKPTSPVNKDEKQNSIFVLIYYRPTDIHKHDRLAGFRHGYSKQLPRSRTQIGPLLPPNRPSFCLKTRRIRRSFCRPSLPIVCLLSTRSIFPSSFPFTRTSWANPLALRKVIGTTPTLYLSIPHPTITTTTMPPNLAGCRLHMTIAQVPAPLH